VALHDLVSPIAAFVRDCCNKGPLLEVTRVDLYQKWKGWCDENGHRAGSIDVFGRDLRAVIPALKTARPRVDGDRERRYVGVGLKGVL
jgi:putative DNA primase/helicase